MNVCKCEVMLHMHVSAINVINVRTCLHKFCKVLGSCMYGAKQ